MQNLRTSSSGKVRGVGLGGHEGRRVAGAVGRRCGGGQGRSIPDHLGLLSAAPSPSPDWTPDMKWKNKFWGKSLEIVPVGTVHVSLPR